MRMSIELDAMEVAAGPVPPCYVAGYEYRIAQFSILQQ